MLQTTTTRSGNSKQRPRFKMRCNKRNSNNNNNNYNKNSAMLNMLLFLSCCCACASRLTVEAAKASNPTTTISAKSTATAYLDANSDENGAVLSAGVGGGNNNNNNNIQADVADEILQLPHAFRHQEHYSHRIEQAVNDFKRAQLEQQQQIQQQHDAVKPSAANATAAEAEVGRNQNNYNSNNWPQIEQQQQEHHHRRHEQHLKQHQPQLEVQQHHLRHHNRHHATWEQRVFPALRHQRHQQQHERRPRPAINTATTTMHSIYASNNELETLPRDTINVSQALRSRYFDRDGLYSNPRAAASHASAVWVRTTRGPRSKHYNGNEYASAKKLDEREFSDEAPFDEADDARDNDDANDESDAPNHLNGRRFSLKLSEHDAAMDADAGRGDVAADDDSEDVDDDNDNDENADDADDDYSYEDEEPSKAHVFASSNSGKAKISVKRYTNPFKSSPLRHYETVYEDGSDYSNSNNNNNENQQHHSNRNQYKNNNSGSDDNDNEGDDDNDNDNADSTESDSVYPSDKWNRIEHQHHLKQLQHQRDIQRRLQHHPSSSSSSSSNSNSIKNSAATATIAAKRQVKHDDDVDSIFSRNYIPGTLTRQKHEELGTLEAVHQTRRNHVIKQMQHKALANAHAKQIFSEASCRLPQRRVERIQRDPTKIYTPHCTVLHRCADDTGCCKSDRQTCAPKRTKSVDLYFFVKGINDKRGSIERLTFINHTECHCVDKAKEQPDEYGSSALYGGAGGNAQMLRRATILNCNCPKLYEKILQEDGFCRCDCSSGNTGCDWLKRGMEHFSMIDRKCMSEGRCKPPTCAYGSYIKKHGRCPRREEQLSATLIGGGSTPLTTNSIKSRSYH